MEKSYDEGFEKALLSQGVVTSEQVSHVREIHEKTGAGVVDVMVGEGYATSEALMQAMSFYLELPYVKLTLQQIDPVAIKRMPAAMACEYRVIPVTIEDETINLAICGTLDVQAQENLSFASGCSLRAMLADRADIEAALHHFFPEEFNGATTLKPEREEIECIVRFDGESMESESEETSHEDDVVIELVNDLLADAVLKRASDIHIEPKSDHSVVRYRVDGVLSDVKNLTLDIHKAAVSRIKILSVLDISERRRPQDGSIFVKYGRRDVDFRVAISPTIYGESATLRVLDQAYAKVELSSLGFDDDDLAKIMRALGEPYGFILSTGPTGSGKTTTMYGMLNKMESSTRKIITIEDPVEYRVDRITQIPVNHNIDLGFAPLLRSVLRQDPNVILVGEIRDPETAHVAVQAALTGHLLLSTLHTTDAPEVLLRLMETGVEYFYVREVVKLIVAQRLARKLCDKCKIAYQPVDAELAEMGLPAGTEANLFRPGSCTECGGVGYKDRTGIFEVMMMTDEIRDLMVPGVCLDDVTDLAISQGMHTLWQNGVAKVLAGVTSLEEIRRTLPR